jgi:hypothetical protein
VEHENPEEQRYLGLTAARFNLAVLGVVAAIALAVGAYFGGADAVGDLFGDDPAPAVTKVEEGTPTAEDEDASEPESTPGSEAGDAATPAPADPADTAEAQAAADAAVLTLADLPQGWIIAPEDEEDSGDEFDEGLEECSAEFDEEAVRGELASAEAPSFEGPNGQQVNSSVSVFDTAANAKAALSVIDEAFAACASEFEKLFLDGIQEEMADGEGEIDWEVDVSLEKAPFYHMGQTTFAYQLAGSMSAEGFTFNFALDFAWYGEGRVAGMFTFFSLLGLGVEEEEPLAKLAAQKLREANASLGG